MVPVHDRVLHMLSSTSLRRLSFCSELDPLPPPADVHMLCVAITKLPSVNSITNIFIIIGASRLERAHGDDKLLQIYWPEDVAPLFYSLPALKRLVFAGQCITVVDNLALGTIAESSPNLVELTFTWAWNAPPRPDDERSPEDKDFPYTTAWGLMLWSWPVAVHV